MSLYLIKPGELTLKGGNRKMFEKKLRANIRRALNDREIEIWGGRGRMYLQGPEEKAEKIHWVLSHTPGLIGFSLTHESEKTMDAIITTALALCTAAALKRPEGSFKVDTRRSDKGFSLNSYGISCAVGEKILAALPNYHVDVRKPDWVLHIEIREKAFLYIDDTRAEGGLPVGVGGRGTLLLSGGIDSPVAGFLMAKRGLKIDAVYFHTYPYTSDESKEKVLTLSRKLADWTMGLRLFVVPFTAIQVYIRENALPEEITLLSRASMMAIAEKISLKRKNLCLITGESLGQVASQTPQSMHFTQSRICLPVFRPLVGMDKESIIRIARRIDTFETSILPYDDCCTIFAPEHPLVKPPLERMTAAFEKLELEGMMEKAVNNCEILDVAARYQR